MDRNVRGPFGTRDLLVTLLWACLALIEDSDRSEIMLPGTDVYWKERTGLDDLAQGSLFLERDRLSRCVMDTADLLVNKVHCRDYSTISVGARNRRFLSRNRRETVCSQTHCNTAVEVESFPARISPYQLIIFMILFFSYQKYG